MLARGNGAYYSYNLKKLHVLIMREKYILNDYSLKYIFNENLFAQLYFLCYMKWICLIYIIPQVTYNFFQF